MAEGFAAIVLRGGLEAWRDAGFPLAPLSGGGAAETLAPADARANTLSVPDARAHAHAFLPGLVGDFLVSQRLPVRRELAIVFVDIADSTAAIVSRPPEEALAFVQLFMEVVTEIALVHCGDVKDYEGDGALLYFESVSEAARAAFAIRDALGRASVPLRARLSLNVGSVVVGVIGSTLRRSVALIGPSINLAARLLRQVPPGDIIATESTVARLRGEAPELAARFVVLDARLELKGFQSELVSAYRAPATQEDR